jgi:hypothetical protein
MLGLSLTRLRLIVVEHNVEIEINDDEIANVGAKS